MPDWAIAGVIAIVVLFGATKLPEIARNLGRSSNEFKKGLKEGAVDAEPARPEPAPRAPEPAPRPAEMIPPPPPPPPVE
ncbi:MAG: twin-arginine translocase TatA/TatE family subunit [Actinomycetota bacterium]